MPQQNQHVLMHAHVVHRWALRTMSSVPCQAVWTALWQLPWCTRSLATGCTASLWTMGCCATRYMQWQSLGTEHVEFHLHKLEYEVEHFAAR
jgi:hypothetical protein